MRGGVRAYRSDDNILCLDLGGVFMNIYICKR